MQSGHATSAAPDPAFWSAQRILLTGHTGFKGAWMSLWLERLGATVAGVSLPPEYDPSLFALLEPFDRATSRHVDIRDQAALRSAIDEFDPTIAIHFAAQSLVRRSYAAPAQTFETNVIGTVNFLEALRGRLSLRAALVVTTDKVYRNIEDGRAFREDDPLAGHDPYSASKAATELVVSCWNGSFFHERAVPLVSARAGNVIGGGDWAADRIVPDIWRAHRSGKPLLLRYPQATRPWQHVLEPLAGYLRYLECAAHRTPGSVPHALNFGPPANDVLTVAQLAEAMQTALGTSVAWEADSAPKPIEMKTLALDSSLATATLGWRPKLTSRDAIEWTAAWYGDFASGRSPRELCNEQISRYEALP
jgi:CDP-glucose 4,6-dehydratase